MDTDFGLSSYSTMPASAARRPMTLASSPVTSSSSASAPVRMSTPSPRIASASRPASGERTTTDRAGGTGSELGTGSSAISLPRPMITRCSATALISVIRWEETKTVRLCAASSASSPRIHRMPSGSRPLTGSSSITISGSPSSAPAMPSRCDMPRENVPALRFATEVRPTRSRVSSTRLIGMPVVVATASR